MSAFADNWRESFLAALTFLTRLPVRTGNAETPFVASLADASWAFPLVGMLIGAIGGLAYFGAIGVGLPVLAAALIAIGVTVLVTGGLHEDGLADTADGFGGGASPEDKLAIMRDSRSGAYGVLALIFSVGLRAAALAQISSGGRVLGALIASHALARGLIPIAMRSLEPARADGLGAEAGRPEQSLALWACGIGVIVVLIFAGIRPGFLAVIAAAAAMAATSWIAQRQIGGYTGDVLGAIEQSSEIAALLAIAAWAS